ncbi:hypothetical protein CHS0354_001943 [Potamilus streckersoni]|uniref:HTH araC/xylS-type domain-containing protein n=1 Tax=Potamilus streckersoni TaxID=2493646 RepID=A0AAE0T5T2_9BIVA|nr:hypothetical protein CHS0354_001943 [Potamilus streckersoni]
MTKPRGTRTASEMPAEPEIELVDRRTASVIYLEHGSPSSLIRWHYHDEYEIHLIVASSGKMFVGDYIGTFAPGNLFHHQTFEEAFRIFPETAEINELLSKSQYGIEFFGISLHEIEDYFIGVRDTTGLERLAHFFRLLRRLAFWEDYRLLNTLRVKSYADADILDKINTAVKLEDVAGQLRMSPSYFSRFFSKSTGNRFSDFLNRLRISRACDLLNRTHKQVSEICYEVGFNNISNFNRRFYRLKNMTPSEYRVFVRQRIARYKPE